MCITAGRDLFTGINTGDQVGLPISGDLSSSGNTRDDTLSGYDSYLNSPGFNDIGDPQQVRHRNPNNRHKGKEQREREMNNDNQNRQRVNNRRDSREQEERQQRYPDRDNGRNQRYRDDHRRIQNFPDRSRQNDRASNEDTYVPESRFSQGLNSGTSGVIEEPVGQIKKCEVSPWSEWSECNATCGRGFEQKSRFITVSSFLNHY